MKKTIFWLKLKNFKNKLFKIAFSSVLMNTIWIIKDLNKIIYNKGQIHNNNII